MTAGAIIRMNTVFTLKLQQIELKHEFIKCKVQIPSVV